MSVVLWIKSVDAPAEEAPPDLWALHNFAKALDHVCEDAGVKVLSEFHDYSVMAEEMGQEMDPVANTPDELLVTLQTLDASTSADDGLFVDHGENRYGDLRADLHEAIKVTKGCITAKTKVRLIVVP